MAEIPIKYGKYLDEKGQEQKVIFIGSEKAIYDSDGKRLDEKIAEMKALLEELNVVKNQLNPTMYSKDNLVAVKCTLSNGGYVQFGKLVVVNIRINPTDIQPSISGFPKSNEENNVVSCFGMRSSDRVPIGGYISKDGVFNVQEIDESKLTDSYLFTTFYLTS